LAFGEVKLEGELVPADFSEEGGDLNGGDVSRSIKRLE
jgi:hypothetical protein